MDAVQPKRGRSPPVSTRYQDARSLLPSVARLYEEFVDHDVVPVAGDGLCFLHAVLLQLGFESEQLVWPVAAAFLAHLGTNVAAWKALMAEDAQDAGERERHLARVGLLREVERRSLTSQEKQAFCYVLDRCCGIAEGDWSSPRLWCDGMFIQLFADWLGCPIWIMKCDRRGQVEKIQPIGLRRFRAQSGSLRNSSRAL